MMDSETMARMYAQVVNGTSKEASRFVTDEETSTMWDQLAKEVEDIKAANPEAQFAIPNEVPLSDPNAGPDDPVSGPPSGASPAPAGGDQPPADEAEPKPEPVEPPPGSEKGDPAPAAAATTAPKDNKA